MVKVTGSQGNWQLQVNGSPYVVKGVTWGPAVSDAEKYMPDLASMGVNTIRTWRQRGYIGLDELNAVAFRDNLFHRALQIRDPLA